MTENASDFLCDAFFITKSDSFIARAITKYDYFITDYHYKMPRDNASVEFLILAVISHLTY